MSKRITKAMAEAAAKELNKLAFDARIKKAKNDLQQLCEHFVRKYIPEQVRECGVTYLESYDHEKRQEFTTEGLGGYNYKCVYLSYEHPKYNRINLSAHDFHDLDVADKLVRDLESDSRKYEDDVYIALVNLRTKRNVEEQFPEALPYLDFTECTALVPNLMPLRVVLHDLK